MRRFQTRHGLEADGVIGAGTLAALNVSPASRLDQVRINLERLRWISRDLEPQSLLVDIAGARLILIGIGMAAMLESVIADADNAPQAYRDMVRALSAASAEFQLQA